MVPDLYNAIQPVLEVFDNLSIPYHIGGSVASSAMGIARTTLDVDLVAEIHATHVGHFVGALQDAYYVDEEAVIDAIDRRSTFNLVHLATMIKVDVFLPKDSDYERESFARRKRDRLSEESEVEVYIASAEDVILHKLDWYSRGGRISERQWSDLIGVMKVQGNVLDVDYLQRWAPDLGVEQLLDRAIDESNLK